MPRRPRSQRSPVRRRLPPRPTFPGAQPAESEPAQQTRSASRARVRPLRLVEREAPFVAAELRRIGLVAGACGGLLALLVVVDRLS